MVRHFWYIAGIFTGIVFLILGISRLLEGEASVLRNIGLTIAGFMLTLLSLGKIVND